MKHTIGTTACMLLLPLFFLSACGGGGSTSTTQPSNRTTPPQKIDFKLPSLLVTSDSLNRSSKYASKLTLPRSLSKSIAPVSAQSYAFEELKRQLSDANLRRLDTNLSLLYLDAVWPQIESNCASVATDSRCIIPANTISFTYTQQIQEDEFALYQNEPGYYSPANLEIIEQQVQSAVGLTFLLGEINYIVHSTGRYKYDVSIDLSDIEQLKENSLVTLKQQAKWNEDRSKVSTGYFYSDNSSFTITSIIDWDKLLDIINYQESFSSPSSDINKPYISTFKTKVTRINNDTNEVHVDSSWKDRGPNDVINYDYQSQGRIHDKGGFITTIISFLGQNYHNKESFDADGNRTSGKYCDSTKTDCSDENNWTDEVGLFEFPEPVVDPKEPVITDTTLVSGNDIISVSGLPNDVEFFVITDQSVTTPNFEDVICLGSNFQYEKQSYVDILCWNDRLNRLNDNVKVFKETFNDTAPIGEEFLTYTQVLKASVLINK